MSVFTALAVVALSWMLILFCGRFLCKQVLQSKYFGFRLLLFFADKLLPCVFYAVIIVKTIVFKRPNNWAVQFTDVSAKCFNDLSFLDILLFWTTTKT